MPHPHKQPTKKDPNAKIPDADAFIAFQKGKAANGEHLVSEKTKTGAIKLYWEEKGSKVLVGIKGFIDSRKIIQLNMDFPKPQLILQVGGLATAPDCLYDMQWNSLSYPHLQETWNQRKRDRDVRSGASIL